jgi:hypothetical protein
MFAAGLVIGFSMFAQGDTKCEMDDAFGAAREVLERLAPHSPQAAHYYEILSGFSDAIQRHREQSAREKRPANSKYVEQIITLNVGRVGQESNVQISSRASPDSVHDPALEIPAETPAGTPDLDDVSFEPIFDPENAGHFSLQDGSGFDFGILGWDNFAMQVSEGFNLSKEGAWVTS